MPSAASGANHPRRRAAWSCRSRIAARTKSRSSRSPAGRVGGVRGARRRVVAAGHPDLVAVVDARRARQRQLRERGEPDGRQVVAADRADPGRVVAAQQVQLDRDDVRVVGAELVLDAVEEAPAVVVADPRPHVHVGVDGRLVAVVAGRERQDRERQLVVHVGVELVPLQPAVILVPDLGHDVGVRVRRPSRGAGTPARTRRRRSRRRRRGASRRTRTGSSARRPASGTRAPAGCRC